MANLLKDFLGINKKATKETTKQVYSLDLEVKQIQPEKILYQVNLIHNQDIIPIKNQSKIKRTFI